MSRFVTDLWQLFIDNKWATFHHNMSNNDWQNASKQGRCRYSLQIKPEITLLREHWIHTHVSMVVLLLTLNNLKWTKWHVLLPCCKLVCKWLTIAVRIVDSAIAWAHWANPNVNSSLQHFCTIDVCVSALWRKIHHNIKSVLCYTILLSIMYK